MTWTRNPEFELIWIWSDFIQQISISWKVVAIFKKFGKFFDILLKAFRNVKSNSVFCYLSTDYYTTTYIRQISGKESSTCYN